MSRIYAAGAAMGWTAREVDETSMWKFWAAWLGYIRANSAPETGKLSEAQKDDLWADIEAYDTPTGPLFTETYLWDGEFVAQGRVEV